MKHFLPLMLCTILTANTIQASQQLPHRPTVAELRAKHSAYLRIVSDYTKHLHETLGGSPQEKALRANKVDATVAKLKRRMKAKQKIRAFKAILLMTNDNEKSAWEVKHEILQEILKEPVIQPLSDLLFRKTAIIDFAALTNTVAIDDEVDKIITIKSLARTRFAAEQQYTIAQEARAEEENMVV